MPKLLTCSTPLKSNEVLHGRKTQRIRLRGTVCPEKGQVFGNNTRQATSDLTFAHQVRLQIYSIDKYGRILADEMLADDTNDNHELEREGWC